MGYDDIEYAAFTSPPLTTIRQPAFELGARAAVVLTDYLKNGGEAAAALLLKPELKERRSVKAPRTSTRRSRGHAA